MLVNKNSLWFVSAGLVLALLAHGYYLYEKNLSLLAEIQRSADLHMLEQLEAEALITELKLELDSLQAQTVAVSADVVSEEVNVEEERQKAEALFEKLSKEQRRYIWKTYSFTHVPTAEQSLFLATRDYQELLTTLNFTPQQSELFSNSVAELYARRRLHERQLAYGELTQAEFLTLKQGDEDDLYTTVAEVLNEEEQKAFKTFEEERQLNAELSALSTVYMNLARQLPALSDTNRNLVSKALNDIQLSLKHEIRSMEISGERVKEGYEAMYGIVLSQMSDKFDDSQMDVLSEYFVREVQEAVLLSGQ